MRIRQIVSNLLSNAVKFTDRGAVDLTADGERTASGELCMKLSVRDSGRGIESDRLPLIFDRFTPANNNVQATHGGTGLGLAITKKLVELHGGDIRVTTEAGRGTTFYVTLRIGISSGGAKMPEPPLAALARSVGEHARILIVEDNPVNQKVVTAMLTRGGYQINLAQDGREALSKLEEGDFDVVLMDVQMPILDGLETTRLIRQDPRWRALPIIAMTAHAMNGDRERCLEAGMNGYISKPVHPSDLLDLVRQFSRPAAQP